MGSACAAAARRTGTGGGACRRTATCACSGPALGSASCGAGGCAHSSAISMCLWRVAGLLWEGSLHMYCFGFEEMQLAVLGEHDLSLHRDRRVHCDTDAWTPSHAAC